jgi:hypothetical protein
MTVVSTHSFTTTAIDFTTVLWVVLLYQSPGTNNITYDWIFPILPEKNPVRLER